MPWKATKKNGKAVIVKANTGKVVGHSTSMAKAKASVKARYTNTKDGEKVNG